MLWVLADCDYARLVQAGSAKHTACDSPHVNSILVLLLLLRYNVKRAFKHSMLLHATLYFLLLMGSGYLLVRPP